MRVRETWTVEVRVDVEFDSAHRGDVRQEIESDGLHLDRTAIGSFGVLCAKSRRGCKVIGEQLTLGGGE